MGNLLILLFTWGEISAIKEYFTSKKWTLEYVDYGEIIDKYIKYEKKDNDHYIIAHTTSCDLRYKVSFKDYENFELNDKVVIFAIPGKQETFFSKTNVHI